MKMWEPKNKKGCYPIVIVLLRNKHIEIETYIAHLSTTTLTFYKHFSNDRIKSNILNLKLAL